MRMGVYIMEEGVFKMVYTRTIHWRYVEWRKEICRIEEGGIYNGERGYVEYRKEVCRMKEGYVEWRKGVCRMEEGGM